MSKKNRSRDILQKFYLSDRELDILQKNMAEMGITNKSEYFRDMILYGKKIVVQFDYSNLKSLTYELNKIGVNINQIAKVTNEKKNIFHSDIEELQRLLSETNKIIVDEFEKVLDDIEILNEPTFDEIFETKG